MSKREDCYDCMVYHKYYMCKKHELEKYGNNVEIKMVKAWGGGNTKLCGDVNGTCICAECKVIGYE